MVERGGTRHLSCSMHSTDQRPRTGIVGGGLAGLAAAGVLAAAGHDVTVFDKGRGPGGRASTRRTEAGRFDHGAQYFTARDPRFRALVERWQERGVAAEWAARFAAIDAPGVLVPKDRAEPRWVGTPGISALAGDLAASLAGRATVRFGALVTGVARAGDAWTVGVDGDEDATFDALVVCTPAPQALALLDGHTTLADAMRRARMTPCWAAMLAFDAPLDIAADGLFVNVADAPLAWASRDASKPGRAPGERWVLHATPAWTEAHLDDPREQVASALHAALGALVRRPLPPPTFADAHRWRYAQGALDPAPGALVDRDAALVVAGDWCHGARVEGAWLSGVAAGEAILASVLR